MKKNPLKKNTKKIKEDVEMKTNYDIEFQKIIDNTKEQGIKPKVLLHSCCGPCSSAVLERLVEYFNVTVLYYNPNIEPKEEYEKRKKVQIKLINELNNLYNINFMDCDYQNKDFKTAIRGLEEEPEGGARCPVCFKLRLYKTAELAIKNNFDYFGTTLTVSPHKNSQIINKIGEFISNELNIKYLFSDFKKHAGYLRSIELSRKYDLYRQDYCGCLYAKNKIDSDS